MTLENLGRKGVYYKIKERARGLISDKQRNQSKIVRSTAETIEQTHQDVTKE